MSRQAFELDPPLACSMEQDRLPAHVRVLAPESAELVAEAIRQTGITWMWVEGFPGAGKTRFAAKLAHLLGWRRIDTDDLLGESTPDNTYAGGIEREGLLASLGDTDLRRGVAISGLCLRDVLAPLGKTEPALVVYIARVSNPSPSSFIWHEGCELEDGVMSNNWMIEDAMRYHRQFRPYRDAHFIFLRVENEIVPIAR